MPVPCFPQTLGLTDAAQLDALERQAEAAGQPGPGATAVGRREEAKQVWEEGCRRQGGS